jgi:hypothetical protein
MALCSNSTVDALSRMRDPSVVRDCGNNSPALAFLFSEQLPPWKDARSIGLSVRACSLVPSPNMDRWSRPKRLAKPGEIIGALCIMSIEGIGDCHQDEP